MRTSATIYRATLVATAAISFLSVGGCGKTKSAPVPTQEESHDAMVAVLTEIRERTDTENQYLGTARNRQLQAELESLPSNATPSKRWFLTYQLARLELNQGRENRALELYEKAARLDPTSFEDLPEWMPWQFKLDRAVGYLRMAETENCCANNTPESCIWPLKGRAIHERQENTRKAIDLLNSLHNSDAPENLKLMSRWLLNLSHMAVGEYPEGVPDAVLIPLSELANGFPPYENIAAKLGLNTFSLAGSVVAEDFDRDGNVDLMVSSWSPNEPLKLFWNRDGRFVEGAKKAGLSGIHGGLNMVHADYDNDGHADVLILRGAWLAGQGGHPNSLLKNQGDGTFVDVTFRAGLANKNYPSQSAAWADYDLDGDLDLFVGNETAKDRVAPCQLFQNQGDGTFEDVAVSAGVANVGVTKACVWGDFNGDRYPDLYASNFGRANRLYRNNGDGTFEDVAESMAVSVPVHSFSCWFWDYNNDGELDLFVSAYSGGIADIAANMLGATAPPEQRMRLYENDGTKLIDVAIARGLTSVHHPMGANFGDLNGDGFLDFYLGTGWPEFHELMPNAMYKNDRGTTFSNVTIGGGFGHLQKGHGIAFADFDNDGDQDVFEQMGGFVPGDRYFDSFYLNPQNDGDGATRWLRVECVGEKSNRSAIGTRVSVTFDENGVERHVHRWICSGGSFGSDPLEEHFGLGNAGKIKEVKVYWPTTDQTQTFVDVELDQSIRIVEGREDFKVVRRKALTLGTDDKK